jgi:hypothetical protein
MLKPFLRCAILGVACVALVFSAPAKAVVISVDFSGPLQDFNATGKASGTLVSEGSGVLLGAFPFVLNPNPQTDTISLKSPVKIASDPKSDPPSVTKVDITPFNLALVDIWDLDLDLLNGSKGTIEANTIVIEISNLFLNAITIDFKADITGLTYVQTGCATVIGSGGSGVFSVDGDLTANLSNFQVSVFGSIPLPVADQTITTSIPLYGTWQLIFGPFPTKLVLDGTGALSVPLTLLTALETTLSDLGGLTASFTADLNAAVTLAYSFHLEAPLIPEPGSISLLFIGLMCLVFVASMKRLRQ